MLFIGNNDEIINFNPANEYFRRVIDFIKYWESKPEFLEIKTSGSTGEPKIIQLSRNQILASVKQTQKAFNITSEDQLICNLNLDYIAGKLMIIRALELKCDLIIIEPCADPFLNIDKMDYMIRQKSHRNFMAFVPLQLEAMLKNEKSISLLNTAKSILIGGAALNPNLQEKAKTIKTPVYLTYGMTETVTHVAIQNVKEEDEFQVLDGIEIKTDQRNCLMIKGKTTNNEWITTNDLVTVSGKKSFKLIGRIDEIINSGGAKINPEEVNRIAQQYYPESFAYGRKDEKLGEKVVLFVKSAVKDEDYNSKLKLMRAQLPKFAVPKEVYFLKEFKQTKTGKTDKKQTANAYFNHQISDQ